MKLKISSILFATFLLATALIPAFPGHASAVITNVSEADIRGATGTWVNRAYINIKVGSQTVSFFDRDIGDKDANFQAQDYQCSYAQLSVDLNHRDTAKLDMDFKPPGSATGQCQNVGKGGEQISITLSDPAVTGGKTSDIFFNLHDTATVNRVDGNAKWQMKQSSQYTDLYLGSQTNAQRGNNCHDIMQINRTNNTYRFYGLIDGSPASAEETPPASIHASACILVSATPLGDISNSTNTLDAKTDYPLGIEATAGTTPSDIPGATTAHIDCEVGGLTLNPFALADHAISWILCPLLDGAQAIVNNVGGWVVDQLEFNVDGYLLNRINTTDQLGNPISIQPVKDAWNAFRVISLTLVILVALAGILMSNFIDAYTIKKILPRMLIAIVAISLSWDLMVLALQVTNSLGEGVRSLIDLPFRSLPNASINPNVLLSGVGLASGVTTILGALSFVGTAAVAVLFAFIFTILRVGAIIALVIFAPVAILLWILPGTQKGWKFWLDGIAGALLMFPIVTAFLSIGAAFGKIIGNMQDGPAALNQVMALIATYAPYFLIPKAFSMAGGVVGNLSGMVNDQGRGAFDRLKQFRKGQSEKRRHDLEAGNFFRGGKEVLGKDGKMKLNWRGRFNRAAETPFVVPKAGLGIRKPGEWKDRINDARGDAGLHHSTEAIKNDERLNRSTDEVITGAMLSGQKFNGSEEPDSANDELNGVEGYLAHHGATLYGGGKDLEGNRLQAYTTDEDGNRVKNKQYWDNFNANAGNRKSAIRQIENTQKTYGAETAKLIAVRKRFRSSTTYSYENGFGEMAEEIREASTRADGTVDTHLATQLLEEANAAQTAAGRTDVGGASYSTGITAVNNIGRDFVDENGITRKYTAEDATQESWTSTMGGKSPDEIFRSGKIKTAQAASSFLYGYTDKHGNKHMGEVERRMKAVSNGTTKEMRALSEDTSLAPPEKQAKIEVLRAQETTRLLQWEESFHVAASRSSADHRKVMGNASGQGFDESMVNMLPEEMKREIFVKTEVVRDGSGEPVMIQDPNKPPGNLKPQTTTTYDPNMKLTHNEVWDKLRSSKYWNLYAKEYGLSAAAAGANVAAAAGEEAAGATGAEQGGGGNPFAS